MAEYYCMCKEGPSDSSDASVNTKPTESSKVLATAEDCQIIKIEAASYVEAVRAARIAYGGNQTPVAAEVANVKES